MTLCALLLVLVGPTASTTAGGVPTDRRHVDADFDSFQGNSRHDGMVQEAGLRPPFERRWAIPLFAPSYPLIADGRVFITAFAEEGGNGSILVALDAATGRELWRANVSSVVYANATYGTSDTGEGRLFVISGVGELTAFDAANGMVLWSHTLPGQWSFTSPPVFRDGVVYTGGAGAAGTLYAVQASDGAVLWTAPVENGDHSAPSVTGGSVFVGYACLRVYAFSVMEGSPLWASSTGCEGGGGRTIAVHRGILYSRDSRDEQIQLARTGEVLSTFHSPAIPAFSKREMFVRGGKVLRRLDPLTGRVVWAKTFDRALTTAPLVVNGLVIVGSSTGRLYAVTSLGRVVWHAETGATLPRPDEHGGLPLTGLGAGGGIIIVPTETSVVAFAPEAV